MKWVAPKDHCPWDAGFHQHAINKCTTIAAVCRIKSAIAPANTTVFKPLSWSCEPIVKSRTSVQYTAESTDSGVTLSLL